MTIKLVATDMDGTFLDENGRFDMDRLKSLLVSYKEKGIYFAVASGRGFLSLEKLFADVRDDIIFIAENGSLVEYQGQDLYEATMSREFYLATFEKLKTSPYVDINKLLLTGKKGSYVLDTVDETYLKVSQHYNENIQKVASLEDITDDIFKFTTNFTEETLEAGEAWVNENVPGVKAMTTGFESIDIVLDYVDKGVAIVELAKKLGKSRPYIANSLRLLKLPTEIKNKLDNYDLSEDVIRSYCLLVDRNKYKDKQAVVRNCIAYINDRISEKISLDNVSDYLGVNKSYLSSIFNKDMGISIVDYIHDKRISNACYLLANTDFSISEVADYIGYFDTSYFIRI